VDVTYGFGRMGGFAPDQDMDRMTLGYPTADLFVVTNLLQTS